MKICRLTTTAFLALTGALHAQNPAGHRKIYLGNEVAGLTTFKPPTALSPGGTATLAVNGQFWDMDAVSRTGRIVPGVTPVGDGILRSSDTDWGDYYRINPMGDIAFFGGSAATGQTSVPGLFLRSGTSLTRIAWNTQLAPGGGRCDGFHLSKYNRPPALSDNGRFAFVAETIGTGAPGSALYAGRLHGGVVELSKIAGIGDDAPDGGQFTAFAEDFRGGLAINNSGDIVFIAQTSLHGYAAYFWNGTGFRALQAGAFADEVGLNNSRQALFGYGNHHLSIYTEATQSTTVVINGNAVTPFGGVWNTFVDPCLNERGQVSFIASLVSNGTGQPSVPGGIFLWSPEGGGTLSVIAPTGVTAGGGTLTGFDGVRPLLSNSGLVHFKGIISPNSRPRLFAGDGRSLVPLISYGDTLENLQVTDLDLGDQESRAAGQGPFNDKGQFAYWAKLGTGSAAREAVMLYTPSPLEQWRIRHLRSHTNAGPTADLATPQGDGVSNLMKFATGMDPTKPGIPAYQASRDATGITFSYQRTLAAVAEGLTFSVEWSANPGDAAWSRTGVTTTVIPNGEMESVTSKIPPQADGRMFVRLRVAR